MRCVSPVELDLFICYYQHTEVLKNSSPVFSSSIAPPLVWDTYHSAYYLQGQFARTLSKEFYRAS